MQNGDWDRTIDYVFKVTTVDSFWSVTMSNKPKNGNREARAKGLTCVLASVVAITILLVLPAKRCLASRGSIEPIKEGETKAELGIPYDKGGWIHGTENFRPSSTWNHYCVCTRSFVSIKLCSHGYAKIQALVRSPGGYYPEYGAWTQTECAFDGSSNWHVADRRGAKAIYDSMEGEGSGGITIWYFHYDGGGSARKESSRVEIDGIRYVSPDPNPYDLGFRNRIQQWQFGIRPADTKDIVVNSSRDITVCAADRIWIDDPNGAMAGDAGSGYPHYYVDRDYGGRVEEVLQAYFKSESVEYEIPLEEFRDANHPFIAPCDGTLYWYSKMNQSYVEKRGGFIFVANVFKPYGGGDGTRSNPFQIADANHLNLLSNTPEDWNGDHFILADHIKLTSDDPRVGGIGTAAESFAGVFDGNGHVIYGVRLDVNDSNSVGLFGVVDGGTIRNLGIEVEEVKAVGATAAGALVGCLESGTVTCCCVKGGSVSGAGRTGGLIGDANGLVCDCYSQVVAYGPNDVGGLIGRNRGQVHHSYWAVPKSTGMSKVEANFGALIGHNEVEGTVTGGLWLSDADLGNYGSAAGTGRDDLKVVETFLEAGWDFVGEDENGTDDIWSAHKKGKSDYPFLWWEENATDLRLLESMVDPNSGEQVYVLEDASELCWIGHNPRYMGGTFELAGDLDLTGYAFSPIGSEAYPFRGVFDGKSHMINNLCYEAPDQNDVGLFGYVDGGVVENLFLAYSEFLGQDCVGGVVGCLEQGEVRACRLTDCLISGRDRIGGLVGCMKNSLIVSCEFTKLTDAAVAGASEESCFGGICGYNSGGEIEDCKVERVEEVDDVGCEE